MTSLDTLMACGSNMTHQTLICWSATHPQLTIILIVTITTIVITLFFTLIPQDSWAGHKKWLVIKNILILK